MIIGADRNNQAAKAAVSGGYMKKRFKFLSLGLVICFVLSCIVACKGGGQVHETPKPVPPTASPKPSPSPRPTDAVTSKPTESPKPVEPSGGPGNSDSPSSPKPTADPNFKDGAVINPDEAPDIVKAAEKEFKGYKIKEIVCAHYDGREAYKVTLQQKGELSKTIYVLLNGDIVIPKMT